jgi:transcriptional regulator with XRE-family HTH domain
MFRPLTLMCKMAPRMEVSAVYREFGRLVRLHRKHLRLSQGELGKRVGLSRTSITNIEQGRQKIPLHQLFALSEALRASPEALLPGLATSAVSADVEKKLQKYFKGRETEWARRIVLAGTKGDPTDGKDQDARAPTTRRASG